VADALRDAKVRIGRARQSQRLPSAVPAIAVLALVLVAMILAAPLVGGGPVQRYETAVGQQRRITLADGSVVSLDTRSVIEVRYSRAERMVRLLSGQAMFDVVHHADRPFHVQADGLDVRDIGTVFDVRREDALAQVTVVSGVVKVSAPAQHAVWTMTAGQQVATGSSAPQAVDTPAFTRWTTGRVEFEDVSLAEAVREMNRYAAHPLILDGEAVGQLRVSGAFNTNDTQGFAKALVHVYGIAVTRRPDGALVVAISDR
jgi:transmembrane sensor